MRSGVLGGAVRAGRARDAATRGSRRAPGGVRAALSILEARLKGLADASGWWSVKPPDHEALRELALPEQIAGQVVSLRDRMHRDLAEVDASRVFWIDYVDFCASPEAAIEPLRRRLEPIAYRNPAVASIAPMHRQPTDRDGGRLLEILEQSAAV